MRSTKSHAFYALAALFAIAFLVSAEQGRRGGQPREGRAGNLLQNANFEQMSGALPAQWTLDPKLSDRGEAVVEQTDSGKALKLSPNARNTDKDHPFGLGQVIPTQQVRGKRLLLQAAMRTTGGGIGVVLAIAVGQNGRPLQIASLPQIESSPTFRLQRTYLEIGNATSVIFGCATNTTQGSVWFNQLYLGPESGAADASPAAPATPVPAAEPIRTPTSGATTASMRIDASRIVRSIPRTLYGTNIEWVRDGNGIFDTSHRIPKPEMVRLSRELGVSLVRYPGGGFADYFHWKDAINAPGARPVRAHVIDGGKSRAEFGIPEFVSFCRQIGAQPLMQANVLSGTAQEAADFVSYCNAPNQSDRTRDGSPQPFQVRYWEIGNEQYIHSESSKTTEGIPTGSYLPANEYAKRVQEFSAAMRKVDPEILIGAVGGANFGRYRLVHDEDWDRVVLEKAGGAIDFLAVHNSYAPVIIPDDPQASFDDVYQATLAFPKQVAENLSAIGDEIDRYAPSRSKHIKIAVTEWGPLFSFFPTSRWVDHVKTLGSALYAASLFQVFLRSDRLEVANFFKFTGDSFVGCVAANGEPKPIYYALQMYSQHFGPKLVQAQVNSPTYDSKAIGLVSEVQGVPYLDSVASLSDDGTKLFLIVVNKHFSAPIPTQVQIAGFRPAQQAKVWVLTAPSLDANNGNDLVLSGFGFAKQIAAPGTPMFAQGKPGTVVPQASDFSSASPNFVFTFVPRSVTALEFSRVN
jgi:alpha-L-arabinofuranosidase